MAEFMGDLAVIAGGALGVWGLLLVHRGRTAEPSRLVRVAGYAAIVIGFGAALCAAAYMIQYRAQGDFDRAYPLVPSSAHQDDGDA